jgi:hypothetical protein
MTPPQPRGPPWQQKPELIAEVMRGVRQQCHRMRREAKDDFRHDKPGIERRADCERPVKTGRRCLVVMVFAAAVIVPGMIGIAVVFVAVVMVVSGHRHSYSAGMDEWTLPSPVLSSIHA